MTCFSVHGSGLLLDLGENLNSNQSLSASPPRSGPAPGARFTRAHNDLYDKIKPELYHKVDRSVLDALVRQLEGFHQSWVALTILQLARLAAVSPWSVTKALGRLEAAGVILRRKKKLTKAGRFIWELALSESFRVVVAPAPAAAASAMGSSHVTLTWEEPMALKETIIKNAVKEHHHAPADTTNDDDFLAPYVEDAEEGPIERSGSVVGIEPDREGEVLATSEPQEPTEALRPSPPAEFVAAHPRLISPRLAAETTEQEQALQSLLELGIDRWKARQLAQSHSLDQIRHALAGLKYRAVRSPAAWIVRELERGGYAPPPALANQEKRAAEEAAKAQQRRLEEERLAEQIQAQQQRTEHLLDAYSRLAPERQKSLLQQVREQLRRISPRLAAAPLDLAQPGPVRSQLLELLQGLEDELGPRAAGPTPRAGGWEYRRMTADARGFSRPIQDPRPSCATNEL